MTKKIIQRILSLKNENYITIQKSFFKTGDGEYSAGDVFLGIKMGELRKLTKEYTKSISLQNIEELLTSKYHEVRMFALLCMVEKTKDISMTKALYRLYMKNITHINNWDLVDVSAEKIVGKYAFDYDKNILIQMAKSADLWTKRVAIVSTFYFLKNNDDVMTYKTADLLLKDKHDLIHKAVGWLIREAGKKVSETEMIAYIQKNKSKMHRTTLRYAIERLDKATRKNLLKS